MVIAIFQTVAIFWTEIVPSGHYGKIDKVTGVEPFLSSGLLQTGFKRLGERVAVTRWADHSAGAAVEALLAPFFPDGGVKLNIKNTRKGSNVNLGCKAMLNAFAALDKEAVVFVKWITGLKLLEKVEGL